MRALIQRVSRAALVVRGPGAASSDDLAAHPGRVAVGRGLVVLVGVGRDDADGDPERLAAKIAELRIFEDDAGKMNRSVRDVAGSILAVSQFTLHADCRKGNRPSFGDAARPEVARPRFAALVAGLRARGIEVLTGVFGADMEVEIVNDGPVTIALDTRELGGAATRDRRAESSAQDPGA
ncbi:MAG: D-aminoacyl-tRNA deacylase [bacterium]